MKSSGQRRSVAVIWLTVAALAASAAADDDYAFAARFELEPGKRTGRLIVECDFPEDSHIYSLEQATPPGPTKIEIKPRVPGIWIGRFAADRPPVVIDPDPVFDVRIEEYHDRVAFVAPLSVADDVAVNELRIRLRISCQICSDAGCRLVRNKEIEALFGGYRHEDPAEATAPRDAPPASRRETLR